MSDKPKDNWKLARLSSAARRELGEDVPEPEPETPLLSAAARAELEATGTPERPPQPEDDADEEAYAYYLVEVRPQDLMPILRKMKDAQTLARYLARLEEKREEVYVRVFYGIYLELTLGPGRYLYMPDGVNAMPLPSTRWSKRPVHQVEVTLLNQKLSEDGYLGPPEYARGLLIEKLDALAQKKINATEDEDAPPKEQPKQNGDDEDGIGPPAGK